MNADRAKADKPIVLVHAGLTEQVIEAFYEVYNGLGWGFLESVYEQALAFELASRGLRVARQHDLVVRYRGIVVGDFRVDLLVEEALIVEIKAATSLAPAHDAQLLNYLRASGLEVGLLLTVGPRPSLRRRVMTTRPGPPDS